MAFREWLASLTGRETDDTTALADASTGRFGPYATREVALDTVDPTSFSYQPDLDGEPDPGEVVWTWVPYVEEDGRGKDRPVLILVREAPKTFLAVHLTSHDHGGDDPSFVPVGSGGWDADGRQSWAATHRLFRIHTGGIRRQGAAVTAEAFERVVAALRDDLLHA